MINTYIKQLCNYAIDCYLIKEDDRTYCTNRILELLNLDSYTEPEDCPSANLEEILNNILDFAVSRGLIEDSVVFVQQLGQLLADSDHSVVIEQDIYGSYFGALAYVEFS